ncbi:MAG: hypothetical protein ACJAT1_001382 [Marivirga sp.]|jgi:hypothetical protein
MAGSQSQENYAVNQSTMAGVIRKLSPDTYYVMNKRSLLVQLAPNNVRIHIKRVP